MDAPLPALGRPELEVLHRIGDVGGRTIDARLDESPVQQPAGRPDERFARAVLLITGCLADDQHGSVGRTRTEHRLRRVLVQVTSLAVLRRGPQLPEVGTARYEIFGAH